MNKKEIEKIKQIAEDANDYLDTEGVEMLEEAITEQFPEITFESKED